MKWDLATLVGIYALCVGLVSLLWHRPVVLSLCLLGASILMLRKWHSKSDLTFYLVALVLGPVGEIVAVGSGAWEYAKPSYLIPMWLPFLWGVVALFLKRVSETLSMQP